MTRRKTVLGVVIAVAAALAALISSDRAAAAPPPAPSPGTAEVTIVHGLRGQLVDVYVDGTKLLDGFQPDRLTDPLTLPVGVHHVELRTAGAPATSVPKASSDPNLGPGPVAIVAHFAPDGSWTMTTFANDVGVLGAGIGRVVFRNTAGVSPVDVRVVGAGPIAPLVSGQEQDQDLPAASYAVQVGAADGTTLVPDNDIAVDPGSALVLYLVGHGSDITWLSQRIATTAAAPAAVKAGDSGLLDAGTGRRRATGTAVIVLAAGILLAGAATSPRRGRRPRTGGA